MAWGMKWPRFNNSGYTTVSKWKDIRDMTRKAEKVLEKNKSVEINAPTSIRSFSRGDDGTYRSGQVQIGLGLPTEVEVASSAVAEIRYSPERNICSIRFVNGDKWYDYSMNQEQFQDFLSSQSKGRYVNNVMKNENRIPGY